MADITVVVQQVVDQDLPLVRILDADELDGFAPSRDGTHDIQVGASHKDLVMNMGTGLHVMFFPVVLDQSVDFATAFANQT